MGGSMHAFFLPFGVYPNNALVGGSADIATGSALYKKIMRAKGITIANIGDASSGCGPVWEAMGFASMAQFRTLWDEAHRGGLPMVFNFMDNFYGMGGQPIGETAGFDRLARIGAAFNPENMHAEVVDGNNPLALADAYARKMEMLAAGKGPVLLDVICYRQSGHSPSDQSSYRERDEIDSWRNVDPLHEFGQQARRREGDGRGRPQGHPRIRDEEGHQGLQARRLAGDHAAPRAVRLWRRRGDALQQRKTELPGLADPDDVNAPLEQKRARAGHREEVAQGPGRERRGAEAEQGRHAERWHVRSARAPLLQRLPRRRLWRGKPRLGRRVRRVPGA
jgi:hypothetical protein